MPAFKIIAKAAVAFYDELFHVALMGFATLLGCALALVAPTVLYSSPTIFNALFANTSQVIVLLITILLVAVFSLPGALTVAGLYAACQKTVRGEGMKWHHYWGGIKEFGLRTWLVWLLMLAGFGIAAVNIIFYNTPEWSIFPPQAAKFLTPIWIIIAVLWALIHVYVQPYLMELVEPKAKYIYRNSLFLVILHPFATLLFVLITVVVLILSVALPVLLIFSPAFVIILGLTAVRYLTAEVEDRVKQIKEQDRDTEEEQAQSSEDSQQVD